MANGSETLDFDNENRTVTFNNIEQYGKNDHGIGYKSQEPNMLIRQQSRVRDVIATAKKSKWKWAGHVAR